MSTETTPTGQHASVRRFHLASILLLAASVLWCVYWFLRARGYWEDDAWIHLEFAHSLAAGRRFAFNGHVVDGDTSPLWVILLAAVHLFVPDWLSAGKLLTVLGAIFGLTGVYAVACRIGRQLLGDSGSRTFAAAIVLLTAVNPYTCYWIFSGMEPIAAAGVACWAVLAATRERPSGWSFLAGCALAGLGPLLRPEMALLAMLLAAPLLHQWRGIRGTPSARRLLLWVGVMLLAAPLAAWSLYSLQAFGHLLPSTVAAKRAPPQESIWFRMLKVYALGLPVLFAAPFALPAWRKLRAGLSQPAVIFLFWTALTLIFYVANRTYVQSRYVMLTAPGLLAALLAILLAAWPRAGRMVYAVALGWSAVLSLAIVRPFLRNKEINCQSYSGMALFIRDHLPPDAPVAVYSIGQIAFLSQHPIVDTGGITRPAALAYLNASSDAQLRWAVGEGAQYAIAGQQPPEDGAEQVYHVSIPFIGWTLNPAAYRSAETMALWKLAPDNSQHAGSFAPPRP